MEAKPSRMNRDEQRDRTMASPTTEDGNMFPLLRLPIDLIHQICSIMPNDSLFNLSCTSRFIYKIAQPYLYEDIHTDPRDTVDVAQVVFNRPDLARNVRHLHLYPLSWIRQPSGEKMASLLQNPELHLDLDTYVPTVPRGPTFMYNTLALLLLRVLPNLESLTLEMSYDFRFTGPLPILPCLRELHLKLMVGGQGRSMEARYWRMKEPDANWIREAMPNLETLGLNAISMSTDQMDQFPTLKTVNLNGDGIYTREEPSSVTIRSLVLDQGQVWLQTIYYLLRACTQLTSITCTVEDLTLGLARHWDEAQRDEDDTDLLDENFVPRILRILRTCRQTLREIRLNQAPRIDYRHHPGLIGSFQDFTSLEYLSIPASMITMYEYSELEPAPVLDIFPKSLRTLVILKDCDTILPQLVSLVEGLGIGLYPKLEALKLQIPLDLPQGTALPSRAPEEILGSDPCFGKLKEMCRQKGVEYSVVPVWKNDAADPIKWKMMFLF